MDAEEIDVDYTAEVRFEGKKVAEAALIVRQAVRVYVEALIACDRMEYSPRFENIPRARARCVSAIMDAMREITDLRGIDDLDAVQMAFGAERAQ